MLNIILITFISFIPIVFWAYIFSNLNDNSFNRKRFLVWIFAGTLSVIPILYLDKIIDFIKFNFINFFEYAKELSNLSSMFNFSFSLALFLFLIVFFSFIISIFINKKISFLIFVKNFLVFLVFIIFIAFIFLFFSQLNFLWQSVSTSELFFRDVAFNSLKLVIFYYVLVAFIEEASKHFNFLSSSIFQIKKVEDWVLYAIFVALWFSFIENILYFYNMYLNYWLTFELVQTYFFRSIFSLMLHVFTSSVIAYFFTKAYLQFKNTKSKFLYLNLFFIGIFFSILIHFIFDISLEFWFNFIMILFFVIGYLYIASIFYKE